MEGMQQEQQFLRTLSKAKTYQIHGESLSLFSASGQPVARLESRYMQ